RAWLATLVDETATTEEVLAFNDLFRRARARRGVEVATPQASWLNVAFTHPGLAALGVPETELSMFPEAFRQGMAARAQVLGDVADSARALGRSVRVVRRARAAPAGGRRAVGAPPAGEHAHATDDRPQGAGRLRRHRPGARRPARPRALRVQGRRVAA